MEGGGSPVEKHENVTSSCSRLIWSSGPIAIEGKPKTGTIENY